MKKKMLLHTCCAPCASGVTWQLEDYDLTLLFYNPNIDSIEEYNRRLEACEIFCNKLNLKLIAVPYNHEEFSSKIIGRENDGEGGKRCEICISLRLEFTSKYVKENGYDIWASTLSVSPHKDYNLINSIGSKLQDKYNCEYYPSNFKKNNGFLKSIQLSKKLGLYRQNYCGCEFSIR